MRSSVVSEYGAGVYLHGFDRNGVSTGQGGPYLAGQEAALAAGRKGLRSMGAYRIVRVEAADPAAAAVLAEQVLRASGADIPPEPRSIADRLARVAVVVLTKVAVFRAKRGRRR